LALAALALVVFGAYDSYPSATMDRQSFFKVPEARNNVINVGG